MLLAGDIGGTNVRLDFFEDDGVTRIDHPARQRVKGVRLPMTYAKCEILDALRMFADDFADELAGVSKSCFGIAGKITEDEDGIAHVAMANRPNEDVTDAAISKVLDAKVRLVNDMAAHIASVGVASKETLQPGREIERGVRAVLMPGTGCGVGFAVHDGSHHRASPSEGGHFELPPRTVEQGRLLRSLRSLLPAERNLYRVTYETVLSGPGLENIYACLANPETPRLLDGIDGRAITDVVGGRSSPADPQLAATTTRLFMEFLGQYAGNLGVLLLPTAGLWIGGNIADAVRRPDPDTFDDRVIRAFLGAGSPKHRDVLEEIPVHLLDPIDTGLLGAAQTATRM
ncbi:MAG: glucokinase [Planctomycetota bacterium]